MAHALIGIIFLMVVTIVSLYSQLQVQSIHFDSGRSYLKLAFDQILVEEITFTFLYDLETTYGVSLISDMLQSFCPFDLTFTEP